MTCLLKSQEPGALLDWFAPVAYVPFRSGVNKAWNHAAGLREHASPLRLRIA